jgi:acetyltransferase-like isoleucine patch superfamily enzyme
MKPELRPRRSIGTGHFEESEISKLGEGVVFEDGVRIWNPQNVEVGDAVYVGHNTMLIAWIKNKLVLEDGVWIGQQVLIHSAGGVHLGRNTGFGAGTKIFSSTHSNDDLGKAILHSDLVFGEVVIEEDALLGYNVTVMPGVRIGKGATVGAGSVVTRDVPPYTIVAGVPAKPLRTRQEKKK